MESETKTPFKIKNVKRNMKKAIVAGSLEELRTKASDKFDKIDEQPTIHLDSDGTEIDDEEYFRTLDANTELIAVFPGEHWIDPAQYVTISNRHDTTDAYDFATSATTTTVETARIRELVGKLQSNLCNVSVMSDPDLDSLSNMDPNSLVDITGKDFIDQLKDSGRPLCAKRNAQDRINLLKLLKDGAIFCSERYPEEAEAIDMEISQQLHMEVNATTAMDNTIRQQQMSIENNVLTSKTTKTTATTTTYEKTNPKILINNQTIDQLQQNTVNDGIVTSNSTTTKTNKKSHNTVTNVRNKRITEL